MQLEGVVRNKTIYTKCDGQVINKSLGAIIEEICCIGKPLGREVLIVSEVRLHGCSQEVTIRRLDVSVGACCFRNRF